MSSYGGKELASAFRTVRKNTIQVAEDIPEAQYGHVAGPECKSVAGMLAHIAVSTQIWEEIHKKHRMTTLVGLDYFGIRGRMDGSSRGSVATATGGEREGPTRELEVGDEQTYLWRATGTGSVGTR